MLPFDVPRSVLHRPSSQTTATRVSSQDSAVLVQWPDGDPDPGFPADAEEQLDYNGTQGIPTPVGSNGYEGRCNPWWTTSSTASSPPSCARRAWSERNRQAGGTWNAVRSVISQRGPFQDQRPYLCK